MGLYLTRGYFRKQSLYLIEVVVRSAYTLSSPQTPPRRISLGMLLLSATCTLYYYLILYDCTFILTYAFYDSHLYYNIISMVPQPFYINLFTSLTIFLSPNSLVTIFYLVILFYTSIYICCTFIYHAILL